MSCAAHRPSLADYWSGDLAEADEHTLEEHLFDCDACTASSAAVADLVDALRARLPASLTDRAIARLDRQGVRMRHTPIRAGERVTVTFDRDLDLLVHHLRHDALAGVERIDCEVANAADGAQLMVVPDVVFEPLSGEVNMVCLRHYVEIFPPDAALRLVAVEPDGRRLLGEYVVEHLLPSR